MKETNESTESNNKPLSKKGILNYKDEGSQTVLRFLGIELTAPSGLKNPGMIYIAFIYDHF